MAIACCFSLFACQGSIGSGALDDGDDGSGPEPPLGASFDPAPLTMHRLTQAQLLGSYRALFPGDLAFPAAAALPEDGERYGFSSIAAAEVTLSPLEVEEYEALAYAILEQVFADATRRDALVGCAATDAACVRGFFETFGRRAYRRTLDVAEVDALVDLANRIGADFGDPVEGVRFALASILQSPHFLFRVEVGAPDAESGLVKLTSLELASRLAYLLTDAPPDDDLLLAGETGELDDPTVVRAFAEELLDDPRARPALTRFFRDFMGIRKLDVLDKNADLFPQLTATLGPSMREEMERIFASIALEPGTDVRTLFTSRTTYINEELARIYGVPGITGADFVPYTFPEGSTRAGLLTTPGFLAMNAHKTSTSPTHRGRFVRLGLLCEDIPPPPMNVNTTLAEPEPGAPAQTLRQRLEILHAANKECAYCHDRMDPIGFAFESFDAIGADRTTDNGLPVDTVTTLDGTPIASGVEVGALVATLADAGACVARRFYQHANGRIDAEGDAPAVDKLVADFVASDFDFRELVFAMVVNDGYRYAAPVE